jgi:hypothetical protein
VMGRSRPCAFVLHSPRFCAVFVLGCTQAYSAVVWRLVGIASAVGTKSSITEKQRESG